MWFKNLIFIYLAALLLISCSQNKGSVSSGKDFEIIVVFSQPAWVGKVGDTIRKTLMRDFPGMLEAEPEFDLVFVAEKDFRKILQTHRNILVIDINTTNKHSEVETLADVWSHPQRVIKIKAKSDTAFFNLFAKHKDAIRDLFNLSESDRLSTQNAIGRNAEAEKILEKDFGIKMAISKDFKLVKKTNDFLWLKADAKGNSLSLMIYTFPYKDTSLMRPAAVMIAREHYAKSCNSRLYGGTYISLENNNYQPISQKILFKRMYALQTRGLWISDSDSLAGSFINYTIVDAPRQRIVVFDGYVNYQGKPMRNFIRHLEAIIWGAEFTEPVKVEK